jgi:hypothetical protein
LPIKKIIQQIIDQHNGNNISPLSFWTKKLEQENNPKIPKILSAIKKERHHLQDYYLKYGMTINLEKESKEATNLKQIINFIYNNLNSPSSEDGRESKMVSISKANFSNQAEEKNQLLQFLLPFFPHLIF